MSCSWITLFLLCWAFQKSCFAELVLGRSAPKGKSPLEFLSFSQSPSVLPHKHFLHPVNQIWLFQYHLQVLYCNQLIMVILLASVSCSSAVIGEPACYFKMVISIILSKASKSVEAALTLLLQSCLLIDGFKCSFKRFCKNCMVLYSLLWAATYRFRKSASLSRPRLCTKSLGWLL